LVRGCSIDAVEGFVGPSDDVEGVEADGGLGDVVGAGLSPDFGHVHGDRFDLGAARGAEGVEEALEDSVVAAFTDPDDSAVVVVGDHGEVVVAAFVGDLVHAEPVEVVQPAVVEVVADDAGEVR